jgi:hypothetical protein
VDDDELWRIMLTPSCGPTENMWFISKPGEARKFATAVSPSPIWAAGLVSEGYRIFRVTFTLPRGWDSAESATTVLRTDHVEDVTDQFAVSTPSDQAPPRSG